jgi:hypothetical protein
VSERQRDRQIDFDPMQTHVRTAEVATIAFAIACIVVVLIITQLTSWGIQ